MSTIRQLPHRQAWSLAWPLILSNLTTPLMGLADTAMLGHLDSAGYLAATAIGANILTFSLWMFGFLRMGTTSLTGRAAGANQTREVALLLYRSWLMGALLGLVLVAVQFVLLPYILMLMTPDAQVRELALNYSLIRLSAAPAVLMTYGAIGWFIGLQQARYPLLIMLTVNVLNLLLDWLFIIEFDWGSNGAALASALAEYAGFALAVWLVLRELRARGAIGLRAIRGGLFKNWRPLMRINQHLFVRTLALLAVFSFFTAQSAHISANVVAANAILLQLLLLASHGLDGYAHAAEAMIAQAVGQQNARSFTDASLTAGIASAALALMLTTAFLLLKMPLIALLTDIPDLRQLLQTHYLWLALLPLISVWSYLFDGIFIGAGHTRTLRNWMLAVALLVFLPTWWLTRGWGNHGLWLAFCLFNFARGLSLATLFAINLRQRRWVSDE